MNSEKPANYVVNPSWAKMKTRTSPYAEKRRSLRFMKLAIGFYLKHILHRKISLVYLVTFFMELNILTRKSTEYWNSFTGPINITFLTEKGSKTLEP